MDSTPMASTPSARRAALLTLCCFQLLLCPARGIARRSTFYQDKSCSQEVFREYYYSASAIDGEGNVTEAPFNVCYARGSTGAITTCDTADGTSAIETYADNECKQQLYTTASAPSCVEVMKSGEAAAPAGASSSTSDCTNTTPSARITGTKFNLIGAPYEDNQCTKKSGDQHVVPGEAFGVGSAVCDRSFLSRGRLHALSTCMTDGSVFTQVFSESDDACKGDMLYESIIFSASGDLLHSGGVCTLGKFEDRYEYYRLTSCTTDEVGVVVATSPTPSPFSVITPEPSYTDADHSYYYGPDPSDPIVDDDDSAHGGDGSKGGSSDDNGTSNGGGSDDDEGSSSSDDSNTSSDDTDDDDSGIYPGHVDVTPSPRHTDDDGVKDDDGDEDHTEPPRTSHDDDSGDDSSDDRNTPSPKTGHDDDSRGDSSDDGKTPPPRRGHDDDSRADSSDSHDSSDSDDDDNEANPFGRKDKEGGGGGKDGLSGDEAGALIFGITISILICIFSAVLAFAGRQGEAGKVGPK